MKTIPLSLLALLATSAFAAPNGDHAVSITQDPVVMRLNKDEFRIAFGINGEQCAKDGCSGAIRYRVLWRTTDGLQRSEIKQVTYTVLPRSARTIAVDRQYFDTGEGQHTTDVVRVTVEKITRDPAVR